jgi:hypothetical protein
VTRRGAIALGVATLCAAPTSGAVEAPAVATSSAAAYEDRLIDGGTLTPDVSSGAQAVRDGSGWPRSFSALASTSRVTRGDDELNEDGLRLGGMIDTPNHGAITLDANFRTADGYDDDSGYLVTVYQIGMPMNGGWRVDNAVGAFNTPAVDLSQSQYRFFVPSIINNGLATEWRSAGGLQLHASAGEPGDLVGIYVPTFEGLGGHQLSGGAQWTGAGGWSAALQGVTVEDVGYGIQLPPESGSISAHSAFGALAWESSVARAQLNLLGSRADDANSEGGAWLDATLRSSRLRHTAGAFRMDPDLVWGNQPMSSNLQGGYYRAAFQSRQWLLDGGVDYATPVNGDSSSVVYTTGYARYQHSSRLGLGGGANVRIGDNDAWSTFGFVDQHNPWGIGRMQANYATDVDRDSAQLTLGQTWLTPPSVRFSSSVLVGRETYSGDDADLYGLALNGGGDLTSSVSLDLNARWDAAVGTRSYDNVLASVALSWMVRSGWTVAASYYLNRTSGETPLEVESPIPDDPAIVRQDLDDQGIYLSVRYEWRAGTRQAPLAGAPGGGSGRITGVLFLDENDNGRRDAGEAGAAKVIVLLNGRFPARTDAEGRFEFPSVAAGSHLLTVVPDNLPLPWTFGTPGGVRVPVGVRDRVFVPLAAQRLR